MHLAPQRNETRVIADRKEFDRLKGRLREAILRDPRLTRAEQRIGYDLADCVNFRTGDAWPPQEYLAQRARYCTKTVARATKRLAGENGEPGLWFTRELDPKAGTGRRPSYRYEPRFDQLDAFRSEPEHRQVACGNDRTLAAEIPDIRSRERGKNVRLTILREDSIREPTTRGSGKRGTGSYSAANEGLADEGQVITFVKPEAITIAAASGGAPRFCFERSEPWRAWQHYRKSIGSPSLPRRERLIFGRFRTGADVPTLYPPGYGPDWEATMGILPERE
jgi:hypothetical protein